MRSVLLACVVPALAAASAVPANKAAGNKVTKIAGDYVEARTASVFAGACHYNGELVTTGRDAIMAWRNSHRLVRMRFSRLPARGLRRQPRLLWRSSGVAGVHRRTSWHVMPRVLIHR